LCNRLVSLEANLGLVTAATIAEETLELELQCTP